MREIKFRAWDTKQKRMKLLAVTKWQDFTMTYTLHRCIGDVHPVSLENIILMQYIGAKDKKGTKIYEGDIIQSSKGIYRVGFKYMSFVLYVPQPRSLSKPKYKKLIKNCEVIGNIYENPELLEPKNNG